MFTVWSCSAFLTSSLQLVCSVAGCALRRLFLLKLYHGQYLASLIFWFHFSHLRERAIYLLLNIILTTILNGKDWLPRILSPLRIIHWNKTLFLVGFCHFSLNKMLQHPKLLELIKRGICFWGNWSWSKSFLFNSFWITGQQCNYSCTSPSPIPVSGHLVWSEDFLGTKNSSIWWCYMWLL